MIRLLERVAARVARLFVDCPDVGRLR